MPAFALSLEDEQLSRYDVVGQHAPGSDGFVRHVGLYNSVAPKVAHDQVVEVAHMGPPLESNGQMTAHVAGWVPLTAFEIRVIETWIEKIADEYQDAKAVGRRKQFWIDPPWRDESDRNTGVRRYRRYSCAGFVLDAHRQVDIELLILERSTLPEVDAHTLKVAYGDVPIARLRGFGLDGDGPWRIVLAGYVLHSLSRSDSQIRAEPYQVQPGDERF